MLTARFYSTITIVYCFTEMEITATKSSTMMVGESRTSDSIAVYKYLFEGSCLFIIWTSAHFARSARASCGVSVCQVERTAHLVESSTLEASSLATLAITPLV